MPDYENLRAEATEFLDGRRRRCDWAGRRFAWKGALCRPLPLLSRSRSTRLLRERSRMLRRAASRPALAHPDPLGHSRLVPTGRVAASGPGSTNGIETAATVSAAIAALTMATVPSVSALSEAAAESAKTSATAARVSARMPSGSPTRARAGSGYRLDSRASAMRSVGRICVAVPGQEMLLGDGKARSVRSATVNPASTETSHILGARNLAIQCPLSNSHSHERDAVDWRLLMDRQLLLFA